MWNLKKKHTHSALNFKDLNRKSQRVVWLFEGGERERESFERKVFLLVKERNCR